MRLLLVCLDGAAGTGLRYAAAILGARWLGADFPYATLVASVSV
jgi:fluoride ion exporter CrcB/FEX